MKRLTQRIFRKFVSYFTVDISNIQFIVGQSAILTSRSMSGRFQNLWDAEVKVFSQWGEDGILDYLCECLDLSKPKVLEIGAGNFHECNSRFLAENRNASVVAVDGRDDLISSINNNPLKWKNHIFSVQEWVSPMNINHIVSTARDSMLGIDIFSLDLDGNDYWILEPANLDSVSIIVVEYNPLFGSKLAVSVPRDDKFDRTVKHFSYLYYGASLPAYVHILSEKGFSFVGSNRVGSNGFFVRKDLVQKIKLVLPTDFSLHTDWRIRESRDNKGRLDYLSNHERLHQILGMPLINVKDRTELKVDDIL